LFDVSRFPSYGKLSRKNLDELVEGARVEARYEKKNPADFVLWKRAKPDEPSWESPWGRGRPGWHIECSAMAMKYLGPTLDIHAGGIDLIFPHHENEIAQSEAATGKPFARFFLHNGYVNINREKMSKSLGNIVTVRELTQKYSPSVLRLAIFSAHYRSPINLDENLLQSSCQFEERIKNFLRNIGFIEEKVKDNPPLWKEDKEEYRKIDEFYQSFQEALADDFNTPQALGVLGEFLRLFNQYLAPYRGKWDLQVLEKMRDFLKAVEEILGIIPEEEMKEEDEIIIKLVEERERARKNRDWERGDRLREEIRSRGYIVEDTPLGPRFFKMEE
ncbi:MAG TPA: cysteine--tRNA ligase, partial [Candidatus Atribacteria bacterium]|nr:cysteine--tRNA ligase [Candidatus Atribacteria bacterium]